MNEFRLATALALAEQGIPVFPVTLIPNPNTGRIDKKPLIDKWRTRATTDPQQIREWFGQGDAAIGVPTGSRSGFDALDVDPEGFDWYEQNKSRIPVTRRHTTGRGGSHLLFNAFEGMRNSENKWTPGIDVRGEGGFILWWPGQGLPLADEAISDWPSWLVELAMAGRARRQTGQGVALDIRKPPSAREVVALFNRMPNPLKVGRTLYVRTMLAAKGCLDALIESDELDDFDDEAAIGEAAVDWANRWEGPTEYDEAAKWANDWAHRSEPLAGWQTLTQIAGELIPGYREEIAAAQFGLPSGSEDATAGEEAAPKPPSGLFRVLTVEELFALPDPKWLIPDFIVEKSLAVIYGPYRSFKSFIALDWGLCLATGSDWCGRKIPRADVLYIVGEGLGGLKLRIEAWMKHRQIDQPPAGFRVVPVPVNMMLSDQAERLVKTIVEEHRADGFKPKLVVIDTLHRSMSGGDENSAKDIGVAVDNATQIQRRIGCAALMVHHAGKDADRGLRGSTGLPGAADGIARTTRVEDCVSLLVEKQKDFEDGQELHLRAQTIQLASDPVTLAPRASLVLVEDASAAAVTQQPRKPLTIAEKMKGLLIDLIASEGVPLPGGTENGETTLAVPACRWLKECEAQGFTEAKELKQRMWKLRQIQQKLIAEHEVHEKDDLVWAT